MEKISIIIPVYNNELFLDKCLTSVINQTYKNLEIILINDGSKDKSLKIMKKYEAKDNRIIIIDKENEGVSIARNKGIDRSTGKYITFLDSDDYLELNAIEIMYQTLNKQKVNLLRSNYQVHYSNKNKIDLGDLSQIASQKYDPKSIKKEIIPRILSGELPCFVYLLMIKRELLLKTNLFPINIHMMEDVVLYLDLLTKTDNLYIINKPTYNIFYNESGATNNKKNYERNILNILEVNSYLKEILKKEKIATKENLSILDTANCEAISDFIFKQYLSGENIKELVQKLSQNSTLKDIFNTANYQKINFQRRIILKLIFQKRYKTLKVYFIIRKKIHDMKG